MTTLRLPGDKSLSHRALMLAALATGTSKLANLSTGTDVAATRRCLEACGINISSSGSTWTVTGRGGEFTQPAGDLDAGNSGTTARLLTGLLAGRGIKARIVGDRSLSKRPFRRIATPLNAMGARIGLSPTGSLPLTIDPAELTGLNYTLPIASAQVKSAILFAGLSSSGKVTLREQFPTRDHSERMLAAMGSHIIADGGSITLGAGAQHLSPLNGMLPGDPSSAAFPSALAAALEGKSVRFSDLLLNPRRLGFFAALKRMGAAVKWEEQSTFANEPVGTLEVTYAPLRGITIGVEEVPGIIDELPILAVLATQAEGQTIVTGASELRRKESDRIAAICHNLARMGAKVSERPDGFDITGPTPLKGASITTFGDHRIAMAFAVAAHFADGATPLDDPGCMAISFPGCEEILKRVAA